MRNRIDTQDHVLVNLPSGKWSVKGRKPIYSQVGGSCVLFATRRIAVLDKNKEEEYIAFETLKWAFAELKDVTFRFKIAMALCKQFNIDVLEALNADQYIQMIYSTNEPLGLSEEELLSFIPDYIKWNALYCKLMNSILATLFNIQESTWHPKQGPEALMDSLRKNGAHVFIGKFGAWSYSEKTIELASENLENRKVYSFQGSYIGSNLPGTHAVVVDQMKRVNGEYWIFFRDPNDDSIPNTTEEVYSLSYKDFVDRLTDMQCLVAQKESPALTFGWVSSSPEKLIEPVNDVQVKSLKRSA